MGMMMNNLDTTYNVLFLGSGNCARSIMAEAILNREGLGHFRGYSAGITAVDALDPRAVDLLIRMNYDVASLRPKSWNELAGETGVTFDFVFTVCEEAALLPHSMWQSNPVFAHWGIADPAKSTGSEAQLRLAYADTFRMLSNRISIFVSLPLHSLDRLAMQRKLDLIGGGKQASVVAA